MSVCVVCATTAVANDRMTCGPDCHEKFVTMLEFAFGKTKRVTSAATGKTHLVPTRHIIEHGLRTDELATFPEEPRP